MRCLSLPVLLAVLLLGPPAHADRVVVTTQNVRVGLPAAQAEHDIRQAAQGSSVVVTQEMGRRRAAAFAPPGWGSAHSRVDTYPRRDCATFWDRDHWQRVRSYAVMMTAADDIRAGHRWALVTVLRGQRVTLAVVCVHLITHALQRPRVYRAGVARLDRLLEGLADRHRHVIVGGDWNLGHRVTRWGYPRAVLRADWHTARPPYPTGHGGGRIDWFYWRGLRLRGIRTIGGTYSDHNGVRVALRTRGGG